MRISVNELEHHVAEAMQARGIGNAAEIGWACAWLECCSYPGLALLAEALGDDARSLPLVRDVLGIDLQQVSCVFLAPAIILEAKRNGRVFLRNVRHGLYLLPFTVREGLAIGCPVDPAFAVGGARSKNPYKEKLAAAQGNGLTVDEGFLSAVKL
jgi:hypothetical protein